MKNAPAPLNFSRFVFGAFYFVCIFRYLDYLAGKRDVFTDTFPPHAEGAD